MYKKALKGIFIIFDFWDSGVILIYIYD